MPKRVPATVASVVSAAQTAVNRIAAAANENEFDNILSFLSGNDASNLIASNSPVPLNRNESEGELFAAAGPLEESDGEDEDDHDFYEDEDEDHPMMEDYAEEEEEEEDMEEDDDDEVQLILVFCVLRF
jgi:hypothetical protein